MGSGVSTHTTDERLVERFNLRLASENRSELYAPDGRRVMTVAEFLQKHCDVADLDASAVERLANAVGLGPTPEPVIRRVFERSACGAPTCSLQSLCDTMGVAFNLAAPGCVELKRAPQPAEERVRAWGEQYLRDHPSSPQLVLKRFLDEIENPATMCDSARFSVGDEVQTLQEKLKLAVKVGPAVQSCFQILRASTNASQYANDPNFAKLEFGICDRSRSIPPTLTRSHRLPLVVPIKIALETFPNHFECEGSFVYFNPGLSVVEAELRQHLMESLGVQVPETAWSLLSETVRNSHRSYTKAWHESAECEVEESIQLRKLQDIVEPPPQAAAADSPSVTVAAPMGAVMQLDPATPHSDATAELDALLGEAKEANEALMKALGAEGAEWTAGFDNPRFLECRDLCDNLPCSGVVARFPPVKSRERSIEKADSKYARDYGEARYRRLCDYSRMALVFDNLSGLLRGIECVETLFKVAKRENRFRVPTSMAWRDLVLFVRVPVSGGRTHISEIQLQLSKLSTVREEEHKGYEKVRTLLKNDDLSQHSDSIIRRVIEILASPHGNLQQPVTREHGMLKFYFREEQPPSVTIGESNELAADRISGEQLVAMLPRAGQDGNGTEDAELLGGTPRAYYMFCLQQCKKPDGYTRQFTEGLLDALFDRESGAMREGAAFLKEVGALPRVASREVPRQWEEVLPRYLKTSSGSGSTKLSTPENLAYLARSANRDDLEKRVKELCPVYDDFWHDMDWHKPKERGIVFVLQGVGNSDFHHIWSCADKPALHPQESDPTDMRFYKEPNVEGLSFTLEKLATDLDAVIGLTAMVLWLGGK